MNSYPEIFNIFIKSNQDIKNKTYEVKKKTRNWKKKKKRCYLKIFLEAPAVQEYFLLSHQIPV